MPSPGFPCEKRLPLLVREQEISVVDRLIADANWRHIADGRGAIREPRDRSANEVGTDIGHGRDDGMVGIGTVIIKELRTITVERGKSNDYDMHMGFAASLRFPREAAMGKENLQSMFE